MIVGLADFFSGEICPPRDARRASWRGSRTRGGLFLFRPDHAKSAKSAWVAGPRASAQKEPPRRNAGAKFGVGETHTAADRGADAGSRRSPPRELIWINSNIRSSATQTTLLWASRSRRSPPHYRPRGVAITDGRGWTTVCVRDRCHRPIPTAPRDGTLKGLPRSVAPTRRRLPASTARRRAGARPIARRSAVRGSPAEDRPVSSRLAAAALPPAAAVRRTARPRASAPNYRQVVRRPSARHRREGA